jgi:putative oxidoreductase
MPNDVNALRAIRERWEGPVTRMLAPLHGSSTLAISYFPALRRPYSGRRGTGTLHRLTAVADQYGARLAQTSLALVFIWFGALKVIGRSPVVGLVGATMPFADPQTVVPVLGVVEIVLGATLLSGRLQRLALVALSAHLTGTFLTFVMAPERMFAAGDPLLLTADGEFVIKNLVLISAAIMLVGQTNARARSMPGSPTAGTRFPAPTGSTSTRQSVTWIESETRNS